MKIDQLRTTAWTPTKLLELRPNLHLERFGQDKAEELERAEQQYDGFAGKSKSRFSCRTQVDSKPI
ncbi:hypothetical protein L0156_02665 [bacterium]|nr:hypothetical protein [bacterium]